LLSCVLFWLIFFRALVLHFPRRLLSIESSSLKRVSPRTPLARRAGFGPFTLPPAVSIFPHTLTSPPNQSCAPSCGRFYPDVNASLRRSRLVFAGNSLSGLPRGNPQVSSRDTLTPEIPSVEFVGDHPFSVTFDFFFF